VVRIEVACLQFFGGLDAELAQDLSDAFLDLEQIVHRNVCHNHIEFLAQFVQKEFLVVPIV